MSWLWNQVTHINYIFVPTEALEVNLSVCDICNFFTQFSYFIKLQIVFNLSSRSVQTVIRFKLTLSWLPDFKLQKHWWRILYCSVYLVIQLELKILNHCLLSGIMSWPRTSSTTRAASSGPRSPTSRSSSQISSRSSGWRRSAGCSRSRSGCSLTKSG